ncbi:MAG: uracil-DNA glycosylase [Gammaproteobacteria bacterium]|nr:uracil-DNA glycosylase [Gammaproteobacteria bacterium]
MDERQFNYLQEMDIPLWVSREEILRDEAHEPNSEIQHRVEAEVSQQIAEPSPPPVEIVAQPQPQLEAAVIDEPQAAAIKSDDLSSLDWEALQGEVSRCQNCSELVSHRSRTVFGVGDAQADWLIIGEAPGAEEDRQGEPFVGPAGQLLNAMLQAIGLQRSQVYITNILKCRPPSNRDPKVDEIEQCCRYLQRQIALIQPKVILVVGRIAAQSLLQSSEPVGKLRGRVHQLESGIPLIVTYHPAYLLRAPAEKAKAWHDLKLAHNVFNR